MIWDTTIVRYGIVGFTGLLIDFSTTWFVKEKLRGNKYIANSLGFTVAVISNYWLNKYWTFNNIASNYASQFLLFVSFAIIGLLINNLIIYTISKNTTLNFYISKGVAIGVVFIWNYFLNKTYTF